MELRVISTLFVLAATGWTNDTAVVLGAGGLVPVRAASISMESESLRISISEIRVRYRFRNLAATSLDTLIAFPLPRLNGGDVAYRPINIPVPQQADFVAFQIKVNGRAVQPRLELRAFAEPDVEITATLRRLGIPASVLDSGITAAVERLTPQDRATLETPGLIDCKLTRNGKCWPMWTTRAQYYWPQHFPANGTLEIEHTYKPVVGGGTEYDVKGVPTFRRRELEYILTTANNWSGPIGKFHLTVESDSPEDEITTNLPGLRRTSPVLYEFDQSDFHPTRNLTIEFRQPVRATHPQ